MLAILTASLRYRYCYYLFCVQAALTSLGATVSVDEASAKVKGRVMTGRGEISISLVVYRMSDELHMVEVSHTCHMSALLPASPPPRCAHYCLAPVTVTVACRCTVAVATSWNTMLSTQRHASCWLTSSFANKHPDPAVASAVDAA